MKVVAIFLMSLGMALAMLPMEETETAQLSIREIKEALIKKAVVMGEAIEKTVQIYNVTKCIYVPETRVLTCRGMTGEVECPTIFHTVDGIESRVFGMGFIPEFIEVTPENVRFWLYPRSLDNITYVDHTVVVDGVTKNIVLYYGDKMVEHGMRVTDLKCYERMVGLIKGSSSGRSVTLESDLPVKPVVTMIGEVLVMDKVVSKRWGYGYGWGLGLGYGGWGWGGLGYGYPYGIYGR